MLFWGNKKDINDYLMGFQNTIICEDPEDLNILNSLSFDDTKLVCLFSSERIFNKMKNLNFQGDIFCYERIEGAKLIDKNIILELLLSKYQLNPSKREKEGMLELSHLESLNSVVFKFSILKNINLISRVSGKQDEDVIFNLRSFYYKLVKWKKIKLIPELGKFEENKYKFLKYLTLSCELSFRKTGLRSYPNYIQCILKQFLI